MKYSATILATMAIFMTGQATAATFPTQDGQNQPTKLRLRIAVNQGKWERLQYQSYSLGNDGTRALQSLMIDKLQKCGQFEVMERERSAMDADQQEAAIDANRRQQIGNRANGMVGREVTVPADYIITPEIVGFELVANKGGGIRIPGLGSIGGGESKSTVKLAFRISSAETSTIIASTTGEATRKSKNASFDANIFGIGVGGGEQKQGMVGDAIAAAIDKAVDSLVVELGKMPWKAMVAGISTKTGSVVINRGRSAGLTEGMTLDVYELGEAFVNPEDGRVLTQGDETKVATIQITKVTPEAAFCKVINGKGIKAGFIVHPCGQ